MKVRKSSVRATLAFLAMATAAGCASARGPARPAVAPSAGAAAPVAAAPAPAVAPAATLAPDGPPVDRFDVPLGGPQRGPSTAKVTIVEFTDFQCPFCGRAEATLKQLLVDYPNELRIQFRHNPLAFHNNAEAAAEAAVAAEMQGKFWEMHDKLFGDQLDLARPALELHAAELGLDLTAFRAALDQHTGKPRVDADLELGRRLGVVGTPTFYVNGRPVMGAQKIEVFKQVIDDEIARADHLLARGVPREKLYATLLVGAKPSGTPSPRRPPSKPDPDADLRFRIDVAGAPVRGPADAPITLVEWGDFQCPFCARAQETLDRLRSEYGDQIRFVWRDMPLAFHEQARPAAIAARAAAAQGKFWAMHDRLYDQGGEPLGRDRFEKEASDLGLDGKRFRAALDAESGKAGIDADTLAGTKVGVQGTPTFFVNGKTIPGAQPYETFKALVDAELKVTDALLAKGTPRARLYAVLMKDALAVRPPKAKPADDGDNPPAPEDDQTVYPVRAGDAPSKGPGDAPLVMIVFSDFQCPFCKRVEPTLAELEKRYGRKLRVVWKNYPLPFHNNAEAAAEAAMAAAAQGKFWPMHDKLFENNTALDRPDLERYAQALGLDMARFKADLDAQRYKDRIEADTNEGQAVGVNGTPAVFINGRKINGAYPLATFQAIADAELAKAEKSDGHAPGRKTAH